MAANKIVDGMKDYYYGVPKGTKFQKLLLNKKKWAGTVNPVNNHG